jgi:hypothetical protein
MRIYTTLCWVWIGWLGSNPSLLGQAPCVEQQVIVHLSEQAAVWQGQHRALESFNRELIAHLTESAPAPKLSVPTMAPVTTSIDWNAVPAPYRRDMQTRMVAYQQVSQRIERTVNQLQRMAARGTFRADSGLQALDGLRMLQLLYEDARSLQGELVFLAGQAHLAHVAPTRSPAQAALQPLTALVIHSRVLLLSVGTEVPARTERAKQQLLAAIAQAEARQATLLSRLTGAAAMTEAYRQTLAQARLIIATAENLPPAPAAYTAWGATYYQVNYALRSPFCVGEQSLVASYNQALASMPPGDALPAVVELPRLQVLLPTWPAPLAGPVDLRDAPTQNLAFLIDVSGSMERPEGLPLFRDAWPELVEALRPQDHVSLITFAGEGRVILRATAGDDKATLGRALETLDAQGQTRIHAGFLAGYAELRQQWSPGGNNRLILVTDGGFDITPALLKDIEAALIRGAGLTVLCLGTPDARMTYRLRRLGETGGGTCIHLQGETAAAALIQAVQNLGSASAFGAK